MLTIKQPTAIPILEVERNSPREFIYDKSIYFTVKGVFDTLISILVIIFFLSWMIPLISILIKLDSRGPVFFIQRRVGKGLRSFGCIKFRTMNCNRSGGNLNLDDDFYDVTRFGNFLRKTSLDELPQFLNVLFGQMSIVGPRPHMFSDCARFSGYIQNYKFRSVVKPGITGLAQVNGFRGPAVDEYNIYSRFYYDIKYIKNLSFSLDLKIVLKTIVQVFLILVAPTKGKRKVNRIRQKQKKLAA